MKLYGFTSKSGATGFRGTHADGLTVICMDAELKEGDAIVIALSSDKTLYFANIASKGIEVTIAK